MIIHARPDGLARRGLLGRLNFWWPALILRRGEFTPVFLAVSLVTSLRLAVAAGRLASLRLGAVPLAMALRLDGISAAGEFALPQLLALSRGLLVILGGIIGGGGLTSLHYFFRPQKLRRLFLG